MRSIPLVAGRIAKIIGEKLHSFGDFRLFEELAAHGWILYELLGHCIGEDRWVVLGSVERCLDALLGFVGKGSQCLVYCSTKIIDCQFRFEDIERFAGSWLYVGEWVGFFIKPSVEPYS